MIFVNEYKIPNMKNVNNPIIVLKIKFLKSYKHGFLITIPPLEIVVCFAIFNRIISAILWIIPFSFILRVIVIYDIIDFICI